MADLDLSIQLGKILQLLVLFCACESSAVHLGVDFMLFSLEVFRILRLFDFRFRARISHPNISRYSLVDPRTRLPDALSNPPRDHGSAARRMTAQPAAKTP